MRVSVQRNRCVAAGMCAQFVPEVFDQDADEGIVQLLDATPPAEHQDAVRKAAAQCPVAAILVAESD